MTVKMPLRFSAGDLLGDRPRSRLRSSFSTAAARHAGGIRTPAVPVQDQRRGRRRSRMCLISSATSPGGFKQRPQLDLRRPELAAVDDLPRGRPVPWMRPRMPAP